VIYSVHKLGFFFLVVFEKINIGVARWLSVTNITQAATPRRGAAVSLEEEGLHASRAWSPGDGAEERGGGRGEASPRPARV